MAADLLYKSVPGPCLIISRATWYLPKPALYNIPSLCVYYDLYEFTAKKCSIYKVCRWRDSNRGPLCRMRPLYQLSHQTALVKIFFVKPIFAKLSIVREYCRGSKTVFESTKLILVTTSCITWPLDFYLDFPFSPITFVHWYSAMIFIKVKIVICCLAVLWVHGAAGHQDGQQSDHRKQVEICAVSCFLR